MAVLVLAGPGEPRGGYTRVYRELAAYYGRLGVATLVLELDLAGSGALLERWRRRVARADRAVRDRGLAPGLYVARGLSCVAVPAADSCPVALVNPAVPSRAPEGARLSQAQLHSYGFEEAWSASAVPARLAGRLAGAAPPLSGSTTIITHACSDSSPATREESAELVRAPRNVTDPLFRRVWERSWLVATLGCLVPHG